MLFIKWVMLILLNFFCVISAFGGGISLSPMMLELKSCHDIGTFTFNNNSSLRQPIQITGKRQILSTGALVDAPEIIISPPQFVAVPLSKYVVRIGFRNCSNIDPKVEAVYHVNFRQIKSEVDENIITRTRQFIKGGLSFLFAFDAAVYVEPSKIENKFSWEIHKISSKAFSLSLNNTGNVRTKLLELTSISYNGKKLKYELTNKDIAYPGQKVKMATIHAENLLPSQITVAGKTTWGVFSEVVQVNTKNNSQHGK